MNLASLEKVRKAYAEKVPLDGVSVGIDDGDRAGVIGLNGSGKSTLLRIIARVERPDSGRVVHAGGTRIAFLSQDPAFPDGATVGAAAGGHRGAEAMLDRLGLPDLDRPVAALSGGQRKRVALARVLSVPAELLILDEPTNHLDPDVIEWLEGHLQARSGACVFVTHDRYLLDRLATRVIEVEAGALRTYHGGYTDYLDDRARRLEHAEQAQRKRANLARRELAWLRRGPQARTTKARHRVDRAEAVVASARKVVEVELSIDLPARRLGSKVVNLHNAGKAYDGQWVLRGITHKLAPRARLGVVGPNGSGKSTLLGLIAGRVQPDEGSVRLGSTVHVGVYGQEPPALPPGTRVTEAVREVAAQASTVEGLVVSAEQLLERFLFDREAQRAYVQELSGGERRRLELLRVLADAPNLLLLDEPTNDLDLDTLAVLEEYLDGWPGALVVATHDRYFLDRVCEDLFSVEPDGSLRHHPGGWSAYRQAQRAAGQQERSGSGRAAGAAEAHDGGAGAADEHDSRPRKLAYHEQRELRQLERRIPQLQGRRDELARAVQDGHDHDQLRRASEELAATLEQLEACETRWLELQLVRDEARQRAAG